MFSKAEFTEQIADAYEHLYDIVHLRTHPLVDLLVPDLTISRKERAWQLHHVLVNAIEELDPGPQAPVFSREWRRHRLMVLRHTDGLDPQSVANELAISRRHYYREQDAAIQALAEILWDRHIARPSAVQRSPALTQDHAPRNRMELLRLEAARLAQASRYADIDAVIEGVLPLLQEMMHQRKIDVQLSLPESLPEAATDRILLRQVLMGILGYLIECAEVATLQLAVQVDGSDLLLSATMDPPEAIQAARQAEILDRLSAIEEMATLSNTHILSVRAGRVTTGFEVQLPTSHARSVLVVDDDADALELFRRYLDSHHYHVVTAQTAQKALELAGRLQPYAITLDLMMPDQDGWDVMQTLLNRPDTHHIPIIVCSILRQKDLALSLGATTFLEKPITEQALLDALMALEETRPPYPPGSAPT